MGPGQRTRARQGVQLWLSQGSAVAVATGDGCAGSCWLWKCSERPAGAKVAVTQGSVQMAGGGGWCRRWQWPRAAARQAQ